MAAASQVQPLVPSREGNAEECHRGQCPECKLQLSSRQSLKRHWNTWHKEKTSEELEAHLHAIDKEGKAHVCPTCGKGFTRSNNLKDHQMKLHGETDLKRKPQFKCPIPECSLPPFHFLKDLEHHCEENHGDQLGMLKNNIMQSIQMSLASA